MPLALFVPTNFTVKLQSSKPSAHALSMIPPFKPTSSSFMFTSILVMVSVRVAGSKEYEPVPNELGIVPVRLLLEISSPNKLMPY